MAAGFKNYSVLSTPALADILLGQKADDSANGYLTLEQVKGLTLGTGLEGMTARPAADLLATDKLLAGVGAGSATAELGEVRDWLIARFAERVDALAARAAADLNGSDKVVVAPNGSPAGEKTFTLTALLTWLKDQIEAGSFDDGLEILLGGASAPTWGFSGSGLVIARAGDAVSALLAGEGTTRWVSKRADASNGGPGMATEKARGTLAAPTVIIQNDRVGQWSTYGFDGAVNKEVGNLFFSVTATTPSPTDMRARARFDLCPSGSASLSEAMSIDHYAGLRMYGSVVIDQNRHFQLRSYTVGTLPSASVAGQTIYVSNESGGATSAFSDGTNWRRSHDRAVVS